MEAATNVQVDYQTIPADQFDEKYKLAPVQERHAGCHYKNVYQTLRHSQLCKQRNLYSHRGLLKRICQTESSSGEETEVKAAITSADGHIYTLPFINEWSTNPKENINVVGAIPYINKSWLGRTGTGNADHYR